MKPCFETGYDDLGCVDVCLEDEGLHSECSHLSKGLTWETCTTGKKDGAYQSWAYYQETVPCPHCNGSGRVPKSAGE